MILLFSLPANMSATVLALGDGESFKYRVGWGMFSNAGEIAISANAQLENGIPQIHVTTASSTKGLVRNLFAFDGKGESIFDARDGKLLTASMSSTAGKKNTHAMAVFDRAQPTLRYEDLVNPEKSVTLPIPEGSTMDLLTCLMQSRAWDMKPGDKRTTTALFNDTFYELQVTALRTEKIKTLWGETDTLVLEPTMPNNPKGMFKNGGSVRIWISQDARRLPVKIEVSLKLGTGTAYLTEYTPPASAASMFNRQAGGV